MAYSYDGINWIGSANTIIDTECRALAWNGLLWVAGGNGSTNKLAYSADGINWFSSASGSAVFSSNGLCHCVAWNGSMWIAAGNENGNSSVMCYSYDGIEWIEILDINSVNSLLTFKAIAWNGYLWVACGQKSALGTTTIMTSNNGTSWSSVPQNQSIIDQSCNSIAWNGSTWIAGGQTISGPTGKLAKSTNGTTWTAVTYTGFTSNANALAARRPLPYVGAGNSTPGFQYRASGPTGPAGPRLGLNANIVPLVDNVYDLGATGLQLKNIYFSGDLYQDGAVFSGGGGGITPPTDNFMVAGGGVNEMGGGGGVKVAYTYDGTTWAAATQTALDRCYAVAWNGTLWVAVGGPASGVGNAMAYSSDGINWTTSTQSILSECYTIAWNGSIWVAGGYTNIGKTMAYSYDGINWIASANTIIDTECRALAWNGLLWVAGGNGTTNKLAYSADGINWFSSASGSGVFSATGLCQCVAWNGSLWIAAGKKNEGSSVMCYSYDGINWIEITSGISNLTNIKAIAWNGSLWVACGEKSGIGNTTIIRSINGTSWSDVSQSIIDQSCNSIAWNGSMWIAGGQATGSVGKLAKSTDGLTWTAVTYTGFTSFANALAARRPLPYVGAGNSMAGIQYRASGPTGPTGGVTGPAGPWLGVNANIVPLVDNVYNLGAMGIQFKDVHFSGSLYNSGRAIQEGPTGLVYRATGPTGPLGQATGPTGPTIQLSAHLVPTEDLTYDLGATGLRFRDIHVGGSTIYLGDSVSINATAGGALTATNAAGTVNLITSGGFNGGTQSGSGTTTTNDLNNTYYGSNSFSPPFTSIPIVVASIASVSNISSKLAVDTTNVTVSGCRIYSDTNGASYNWIATARTEALPPGP
jgi:hypothetical protein